MWNKTSSVTASPRTFRSLPIETKNLSSGAPSPGLSPLAQRLAEAPARSEGAPSREALVGERNLAGNHLANKLAAFGSAPKDTGSKVALEGPYGEFPKAELEKNLDKQYGKGKWKVEGAETEREEKAAMYALDSLENPKDLRGQKFTVEVKDSESLGQPVPVEISIDKNGKATAKVLEPELPPMKGGGFKL